MSKVFKNIAVFSLWFAGLVIIAHQMVPHDHHSDASVFNMGNACHANQPEQPAKSPAFPLHCHALNDLTFEKTSTTFVVNQNVSPGDIFILSFFDSNIYDFALLSVNIGDFQKPFIDIDFLRLSSLRAPPALA